MSRRRYGGLTPEQLHTLWTVYTEERRGGAASTGDVRSDAEIFGIGRATPPLRLTAMGLIRDLDEDGTNRREWVLTEAGRAAYLRAAAEIHAAREAGELDDPGLEFLVEGVPAREGEPYRPATRRGVGGVGPRKRRTGPARRRARRWTKKEKDGCGCLLLILACVLAAMCTR